jgi:ubiquinone/menaquinone biosynthesis C-methylase UbiE
MKKDNNKAGWGAERAGRLDNAERRAALPPEETLLKLGLEKGMDFADIGCGVGYFTLPAATIIGADAKAYAADVSAEMLAILADKAAAGGIPNIAAVLSGEYDMKIKSGAAAFALCCNVLHEIGDKERFVREIARILAPGGTLAVIEWKMVRRDKGPGVAERIPPVELKGLLAQGGFGGFEEKDINQDLYAVRAKKE